MKDWFRSTLGKPKKPIIVVSGLPRSGTSLMMQMLRAGGVPILSDSKRVADESNLLGYYEYEDVKRLHVDHTWLKLGVGKAVKIISHQLQYLPDTYSYHILFMRRYMDEIIASQRAMLNKHHNLPTTFDEGKLRQEYNQHLIYIMRWLNQQPHMRVQEIDYNQLFHRPHQQVETIANFLETSVDTECMVLSIDPNLYHSQLDS